MTNKKREQEKEALLAKIEELRASKEDLEKKAVASQKRIAQCQSEIATHNASAYNAPIEVLAGDSQTFFAEIDHKIKVLEREKTNNEILISRFGTASRRFDDEISNLAEKVKALDLLDRQDAIAVLVGSYAEAREALNAKALALDVAVQAAWKRHGNKIYDYNTIGNAHKKATNFQFFRGKLYAETDFHVIDYLRMQDMQK